jgi:hypothetical protein
MSCLGVHFALTEQEAQHLRSLEDEQERLSHVQEVIEEHYLAHEKQFAAESDKSWDAMHRALADGQMSWDGGDYPLNHTVLAGELLYTDSDYIMSLKSRWLEELFGPESERTHGLSACSWPQPGL